jgi:hypothetical protein
MRAVEQVVSHLRIREHGEVAAPDLDPAVQHDLSGQVTRSLALIEASVNDVALAPAIRSDHEESIQRPARLQRLGRSLPLSDERLNPRCDELVATPNDRHEAQAPQQYSHVLLHASNGDSHPKSTNPQPEAPSQQAHLHSDPI